MQVELSRDALEDLTNIAVYIAKDSPVRAVTFTDELTDKARSLAHAPLKRARRDNLFQGLRVLPYGNYNIYYRVESERLIVVRIMNSALDARRDDFL
jgi:toxin ParE1/3/4